MKKFFFTIILILFAGIQQIYASYEFNTNCKKAHQAIMGLRLNEARNLINIEKKTSPSNLIPYYLESLCDFVNITVSQDKNVFNNLIDKRADYISILEDGDKSSPYYNYCLADVYFQWAVARLIFVKDLSNMIEGIKAALEFKKSYAIISANEGKFPDFAPNLKLLGVMQALIDAVPDSYKGIVETIAFKGSFEQGIAKLMQLTDKAIQSDDIDFLKTESLFLLTFIEINLQGDKHKANFLKKYYNDASIRNELKNNAILIYAKARFELYFGKNDDAIETLENFPRGQEIANFAYLDFLCGRIKQNRLDKDAVNYFYAYLKNYKGKHHIKAAYQQIAWYYLLNGNIAAYKENMKKILSSGSSLSEIDKQAQYEADKAENPNIFLLKARLLCDGAYFQQALNVLTIEKPILKTTKDSLEFLYRMGRIYHEWGKKENAIPYYEQCIKKGDKQPWYFSANAALQLGMIYESKNENTKARLYYNRCLLMEPKEYKNSLHTKAKSALKRIQ